jgi:hypothetical protein
MVSKPQALVSLPLAMSFRRFSRRWPDFRQVATISRERPTGSDSTAVAYRTRSEPGFKGSAEVAMIGSYPFSFSSLRTVCAAIFTTCGKHLLDQSKLIIQRLALHRAVKVTNRIRFPWRQNGITTARSNSSSVSIVVSQFDALSKVNSPI